MFHLRSRRGAAIATIATAALLATGCGSSTAEPSASGSPGSGSTVAGSTAPSGPVTITDAQGRTVEIKTRPKTVVAIDWSVIRTLNDLGVEV